MRTRLRLELKCVKVEPFAFEKLVQETCGTQDSDQVVYLDAYLRSPGVGAKTLVVEHPYTDRHYMEEYQRYYASSFNPPSPYTTRVHVFTVDLTIDQLDERINRSAEGQDEWTSVCDELQRAYRGFIVLRPLADAPIGRTILAPFSDSDVRVFRSVQPHLAHPLGMTLSVAAVPFQQQETAVGACATTAVWSALAASARAIGQRGPTPYAITEGATRHLINDRQLPAQSGLELSQLVSSIRACGLAPYVFKPSGDYATFVHMLKCYLASGLPVVLQVAEDDGFHALTAVGFRNPETEDAEDDNRAEPISFSSGPVTISTSGLARLYVHEDRLGPYTRMTLCRDEDDPHTPVLRHKRFRESRYRYNENPMSIYSAVVPLYPKLRLTARGLLSIAAEAFPLVRRLFPNDTDELRVDLRFMLGGDYARELLCRGGECSGTASDFVSSNPLPRYVGLVRFSLRGDDIMDVVCDSTDIFREEPKYNSILAFVPLMSACAESIEDFFRTYVR